MLSSSSFGLLLALRTRLDAVFRPRGRYSQVSSDDPSSRRPRRVIGQRPHFLCLMLLLFLLMCVISTGIVVTSQQVLYFPHGETKSPGLVPWYPPYIYQPLNPDGELSLLEAVFFSETINSKHKEVMWTVVYSDEKMKNGFLNSLYFIFRALRYGRVRDIETFFTYGNSSCWAIDFQGVSVCDGNIFSSVPQEHCYATIVGGANRSMDVFIRTWNHLMGSDPDAEPGVKYERVQWIARNASNTSTTSVRPSTVSKVTTRIGRATRNEVDTANMMPWGKTYRNIPREPELQEYVHLCE